MKSQKKFITHSLDVAGYLHSQGMECKIKRYSVNLCDFIFTNPGAERECGRFMRGEVDMNLQKYIYSREQVKKRANATPFSVRSQDANAKGIVKLATGKPYFYVNGGEVHAAHFTNKEPHITRAKNGNVYKSKREAEENVGV